MAAAAHYASEKTVGPFANAENPLGVEGEEGQGLFSAAMPALVTGFLALAFSSLFSPTLNVNATTARDSYPLLWSIPIGYEGQDVERKVRSRKLVRRRKVIAD
jgi:hypothetical protein